MIGDAAGLFSAEDLAAAARRIRGFFATTLRPAKRIPLDQWAEQNLSLSSRVTKYPGPVRLDRTPYMRGPLLAYQLQRYIRVILDWAAQTGKTLAMQITLAHDIDQDPGPTMVVYPDQNHAKRRSRKHLLPLIKDTPILARHTTGVADDLQNFEYALDRMTVTIGWAGSASILAGEPIRKLKRDEFAKFRQLDKNEGHPVELSARRVTSYGELAKIFDVTTPQLVGDYGDADLKASTWHEYHVPCPACGKPGDLDDVPHLVTDPDQHGRGGKALAERLKAAGFQTLRFENFTWPRNSTPAQARKATKYRCEHCSAPIEWRSIQWMTEAGRWVPRFPDRNEAGFHLPSWYRNLPTTSFGAVAERFLKAQGDPRKLQEWKNGDAAEGWEEMSVALTQADWRRAERDYARDTIPFVPLAIFVTVDLRDPEIHYVVRAWTWGETSALLRYGVIPRLRQREKEATGASVEVCDQLMRLQFPDPSGRLWGVNAGGMDAGYDTEEVYAFVRKRPGWFAMRGDDERAQIIAFSRPEKLPGTNTTDPASAGLITFNAAIFKDSMVTRSAATPGTPGEWVIYRGVEEDYLEHLTAEKKVDVRNRLGRVTKRWKKFNSRNHWFDGETMQLALARFTGIRDQQPATEKQQREAENGAASAEVQGRDIEAFRSRLRAR